MSKFVKTFVKDQVQWVILNRPEKRNALTPDMIQELTRIYQQPDPEARILLLKAEGPAFCAGADLNWMKSMVDYTLEENLKDSDQLFQLFSSLQKCSLPCVAYVHGSIYGGGLGLLGSQDYIFAEENSKFCFSETRLGLAPAVISSFMISRANLRQMTPYMMWAQVFNSETALDMSLINEIIPSDSMDSSLNKLIQNILACEPAAVQKTKALLVSQFWMKEDNFKDINKSLISELRISPEAQNRMNSFLNK